MDNVYMAMNQNLVPLMNMPKMNRIVFVGMFIQPILMIIGIDPHPCIYIYIYISHRDDDEWGMVKMTLFYQHYLG